MKLHRSGEHGGETAWLTRTVLKVRVPSRDTADQTSKLLSEYMAFQINPRSPLGEYFIARWPNAAFGGISAATIGGSHVLPPSSVNEMTI